MNCATPAPSARRSAVECRSPLRRSSTHGTDELRRRILRPTITGEVTWTQLFSEPGAGSDLAGLSTTALRDGDDWIVNGQKVWNTSAHHADYGMLLARTDWGVPKHEGISYFVLPMGQAGRRGSSHPADEPPPVVQRGVPHRCPDPRREPGRRRRRRVAGGEDHADARTHLRHTPAARRSRATADARSRRPPPRPPTTSQPTRGTRSGPDAPTW